MTSQPNRLLGILVSLLLSPCMIAASFFVLYTMEYDINLATLCAKAPQFSAETLNVEAEKHPLVALTGIINIEKDLITNTPLTPKPYLAAASTVEVYAWEEHKTTQATSEQERPAPLYLARWTTTPQQTETFERPEAHENPEMHQSVLTWLQPTFLIGAYRATTANVQLPPLESLKLSDQTLTLPNGSAWAKEHFYTTAKAVRIPQIGDLRQSFAVLNAHNQAATLFCQVKDGQAQPAELQPLVSFETSQTLQRLFLCSPTKALATLAKEYNTETRIKNITAWLLLLFGFLLLLSPIFAVTQGLFVFAGLVEGFLVLSSMLGASIVFISAKIFVKILVNPLLGCAVVFCAGYIAWKFFRRVRKQGHGEIVHTFDDRQ